MKMNKKLFCIMMSAALAAGSVSIGSTEVAAENADGDSIQIVATIFPEYDWVQNILGENPAGAEVSLLLDSRVDLHSYQPAADDILKVSSCDMFVYVGGESDEWVEDVLKEAMNPDMVTINLLDVLGEAAKEEEVVEGMQGEEEEEEEEEDGDEAEEEADEEGDEAEEEEAEYDEHVWLSLRNASVLCDAIAENLGALDSANAAVYTANAAAYKEKLTALDQEYQAAVDAAGTKTLLFGDRFPFRYLTDDYGLDYYAAFVGCSAETEASFETIAFLAQKVDELGLHSVMTIEGTDHRIAETIVQSTKSKDQQVLSVDSMQAISTEDLEGGATYLSIMEKNLEVLKEAMK